MHGLQGEQIPWNHKRKSGQRSSLNFVEVFTAGIWPVDRLVLGFRDTKYGDHENFNDPIRILEVTSSSP